MDTLTLWTSEWSSAALSWTVMSLGFSLRNPTGAFYLMLLIAMVAVAVALLRREFGAAALVSGAAAIAIRHIRFEAFFGIVAVVVAGDVLASAFAEFSHRREQSARWTGCATGVTIGVALLAVMLACLRSADLLSDRRYLASGDELGSFGTGLSWWFPERAAAFIQSENLPGQIFNSYNDGGYFVLGCQIPRLHRWPHHSLWSEIDRKKHDIDEVSTRFIGVAAGGAGARHQYHFRPAGT
jgi:hypothetical protein